MNAATIDFNQQTQRDDIFLQRGDTLVMRMLFATRSGLFKPSEFAIMPGDRAGFSRKIVLSTQIGCTYVCSPCSSKHAKFDGNLSADQLLDVVGTLIAQARPMVAPDEAIEIALTGEGDPGVNYQNLLQVVRRLPAEFPQVKSLMMSTAGSLKGIEAFTRAAAEEAFGLEVRWQISCHGLGENRKIIVPSPQTIDTRDLVRAAADYFAVTGVPARINWMLVQGVNDRPEDLDYLAGLDGEAFYVTLVEVNPTELAADFAQAYRPCSFAEREEFARKIIAASAGGLRVETPDDSGAQAHVACGQVGDARLAERFPELID